MIHHCKFAFGAYVQSEHQTNPTNDMNERTMGCIYLDAMEGLGGGHKLMNLTTGKLVTGKTLYETPITGLVQERVEAMGNRDGVPSRLTFHDDPNKTLEDEDSIAGVDEIDQVQQQEDQERSSVDETEYEYDTDDEAARR